MCSDSSLTKEDCGSSKHSTATGACVEIKRLETEIGSTGGDIISSILGGPIVGIADAIASTTENVQALNNIMGSTVTTSQLQSSEQICRNQIDANQSNIITGYGEVCLQNILSSNIDSNGKVELVKSINTNIDGVEQSNESFAYTDCIASSVVDLFASATSDIKNTALQNAIATSTGVLSTAKNNQTGCSDISSNITACQYVKSTQCCSNILASNQLNDVDVACSTSFAAREIVQRNKALAYSTCSLTAETTMSSDLINAITNKTSQKAKAKSEGLDLNALFNSMALAYIVTILGGVGGVSLLGYGLLKNKGLLVIVASIIMLAIGVGNLIAYYIQKKNDADIIYDDSIRSICDDVLTEPIIRASTYKNAVEYAKQIKAVGLDFFVSGVSRGTSKFKIIDSTEGRAIFITELPDDIDYKDDCDNTEDIRKEGLGDVAVRTTIFGKKASPILLGLGVTCVVLGVVCFIVGGYLMYTQKADGKGVKAGKGINPGSKKVAKPGSKK
jgi:hypothetical protein